VLSFHDFDATPDRDRLIQIIEEGLQYGADVVKLATRTETAAEVTRLIGLLEHFPDNALSVMGMGSLGMASRLLAAGCGSTLNYAAHGKASVEGQWPAAEFRDLLERTGARAKKA
jgi:3-dehydroquinate dehydratase-1